MIDWKDPKRTDVIRFQMVDPNNLDEVYGDIEDVQLGSSDVTFGYYTDTRYSSKFTFLHGNNYVKNMWVRIVHEVPSEGYVNELGTFVPVSPIVNYGGAVTDSYDLQSPLWTLKNNLCTAPFSISKGGNFLTAFRIACERCNRPYIMQNPNNWTSEKSVVYEAGTSYLEILNGIADSTSNRVDLDGHGRILLSPLPDMRYVSPLWELDTEDPRSMIIEGSIRMEPESTEIPNRTIVVNGAYVGVADLPDGAESSAAQRGYVKAQKYSGQGIKSNSAAKALAESYLNGFSKITQWTMQTLYFPAKCGDNLYFTIDGVKHLCMIQSIDPVELDTMTMKITLREVN